MELPLRGTRHLIPSPSDGPPNVHHHHHHHHLHKQFTSNKDNLSKSEGHIRPGFAHKKQCRYPEDPDSIDIIRDEASFIKIKQCSKSMGRKQGLLWTQHRDQANMNQYEINTSGKSKSVCNVGSSLSKASWQNADSSNPEYSYAYCEPIIKKINQAPPSSTTTQQATQGKVSNIPTSISNIELCKTHKPPGNSLRALLTKSFRKSSVSHPDERHTFTTQYGKKENIYEDVDRVLGTKPKQSFSSESVGKLPLDEELKFVELQHNRVMNELNLSIEELLMPSQSESDHLDSQMLGYSQMTSDECCSQIDHDKKFEMLRRPEQPLFATQIQFNPSFDIDSGISGSSSSAASYAGSVRYRCHYPSQSTSRNTTIYETPGNDQSLSPFHLIASDDATNPEAILPYKEPCSSFCCHAMVDEPIHNSTNASKSERRIETISEKVILWNKMARMKETSNSTKCRNKHPQSPPHGPT